MKTTDSVMREKREEFLVPKDHFTFKIAPTMAAVLEMEGEIELEMEGKYYKIMSEEKIRTLISHSLAEARREERQESGLPIKNYYEVAQHLRKVARDTYMEETEEAHGYYHAIAEIERYFDVKEIDLLTPIT